MTLWFDVEDLVSYFANHHRPSGIQRLSFELYREIWRQRGGLDVRFCRHDSHYKNLIELDWPALEQSIEDLTTRQSGWVADEPLTDEPAAAAPALAPLPMRMPRPARSLALRLIKDELRMKLAYAYYAQPTAWRGLQAIFRTLGLHLGLLKPPPEPVPSETEDRLGVIALQPGDSLIALGALWDSRFVPLLEALRSAQDIRFVTLVHDIIAEKFPKWCGEEMTFTIRKWLDEVVPQADILLANSAATATDLKAIMTDWGRPIAEPFVMPIGCNMPSPATSASSGIGEPFVLFVSTIEPRKNHALVFTVWERLVGTMPAERVPVLVFAGRVGWMVEGLMAALHGCNWLNGKIRLVEAPSEHELTALYQDCLFTVYPSFYEGWGLPVTESLSHGKTVAASNRSAIPEAGGPFCSYFDPEDEDDAYLIIRALIEHPARVAKLETLIAERFKPPSWADAAVTLLNILSMPAVDAAIPRRFPASAA